MTNLFITPTAKLWLRLADETVELCEFMVIGLASVCRRRNVAWDPFNPRENIYKQTRCDAEEIFTN